MLNDLQDFLNYIIAERGYSQNTKTTYERHIKKLIRFLETENITECVMINYSVLTKFLGALYDQKLMASSVKVHVKACKSFFKFLKRERIIKLDPLAKLESPKIWQKIPDILDTEEIEIIINKLSLRNKTESRLRAIIELLYGSGLRVSELCNLRVSDFSDDMVRVRNGKGNKERFVPVSKSSLDALGECWDTWRRNPLEAEDFAITGFEENPIDRCHVAQNIKSYMNKIGIKKNVSPHTFRHCFASHLLNGGADLRVIQELMGHSNIGTTGIYLQLNLKEMQESFSKYHPRN